jgi:hypothetical protein
VGDAPGFEVGVPAVAGLPALLGRGEVGAERGGLGVGELLVADRDAGASVIAEAAWTGVGWSPPSSRVRPANRIGSANASAANSAMSSTAMTCIGSSGGKRRRCRPWARPSTPYAVPPR